MLASAQARLEMHNFTPSCRRTEAVGGVAPLAVRRRQSCSASVSMRRYGGGKMEDTEILGAKSNVWRHKTERKSVREAARESLVHR